MTTWESLGIFLLGAGAGALLTAIRYSSQLAELRSRLETILRDHEQNQTKTPEGPASTDSERKSA